MFINKQHMYIVNLIYLQTLKNENTNNQINHENLRNHCMARGSDIFFFKKNMAEIQHLIVGEIDLNIKIINIVKI